jgi:hypothetical protein
MLQEVVAVHSAWDVMCPNFLLPFDLAGNGAGYTASASVCHPQEQRKSHVCKLSFSSWKMKDAVERMSTNFPQLRQDAAARARATLPDPREPVQRPQEHIHPGYNRQMHGMDSSQYSQSQWMAS